MTLRITNVRVKSVDHFGYCGRENHPTDSDAGTVLTVRRMEIEGEVEDGEDYRYAVWYCVRQDGSPVEMIDHEIEAVTPK